jgi:tetratricopeptide (TPR) repeat protein
MYDKAKEILMNYLDNIYDHALAHHGLAYLHIDLEELDQALAEMEKAIYLDPTHYENLTIKGNIYYYRRELLKAEEEYLKLMQTTEPAGQVIGLLNMNNLKILQGKFDEATSLAKQGIEFSQKLGQKLWESRWRLGAAHFYVRSGNLEGAIEECDEAWRSAEEIGFLHGQRRALYYKGLALLKMGSVEEAQKTANDLKEMIEQGLRKKAIRLYFHLAGMSELEAGNFSKAIQYFNDALSLDPYGPLAKRADFIDSLALVYYKSGNLGKALGEYERITTLTTGRENYGDIYAKSFYMLGRICEQQGDTAKAVEHYEKFLDLWKDADPGIAEVDDARKRLVGLKETGA